MFIIIINALFNKGEKGSHGDKGSQGEKGSQGQKEFRERVIQR